jgi:phosphopantothenoylcysteine synthetase/decarboxylase
LSKPGAGFGTETNHVLVINKAGKIRELKGLKRTVAQHLFEQIVSEMEKHQFKQLQP